MTEAADEAPEASAVLVRLGPARYAVPMATVAEAGRPPALTRLPGVPEWLAGVANWRGRILPVADLRPLLGADAGPAGPDSRLLVVTRDGMSLGLVTDGVIGVSELPPGELEPPPVTVEGRAAALLAGQYADDEGPVGVLDVDAVFRLRETLPRVRRSA